MAQPLPDFSDTTLFPSFLTIPEHDRDAPAPPRTDTTDTTTPPQEQHYLLAQVKDNMTLAKPTLVLHDRDGSPFALVFEGLARDGLDLRAMGLRKGCTAVIPGARRTRPAAEGKRGFVQVAGERAGEVRAIPGPLARVLELGGSGASSSARGGGAACCCEACGKGAQGGAGGGEDEEEGVSLKSCTGCGRVSYCSKVRRSPLFLLGAATHGGSRRENMC